MQTELNQLIPSFVKRAQVNDYLFETARRRKSWRPGRLRRPRSVRARP